MDPTLVQYLIFILAALLVILAVIAINARLSRRGLSDEAALKSWVEMDTRRAALAEETEDELSESTKEDEKTHDLYIRAHQNGHHVEKQTPPL